jgi:solute carrier family 25 protein 42
LVFGGGNPEVNPNCKEKNPSPNPKEVHKPPATYIEAKQSTAVEALVAGGIAGAVAKSAIAPADRVKIIFQVDKSRQFSVSNALTVAKNIVKTEGVFGLWRGNGVMMVRVVPYAGVSFFSYPRFEKAATEAFGVLFGAPDGTSGQLVGNNGDTGSGSTSSSSSITSTAPTHSGVATRFIAGSAAGATATAITYPLDLMRARYAAAGSVGMSKQSLGNGLHLANTSKGLGSLLGDMTRVVQKEGVRGLYGGITPTLLGIVPYAGISFATFETLKTRYKESHKDGDGNRQNCEPPAATRLLFGGLAGLFAQSVTYPLDIVRRRIQVVGASGGYVSPWQTLVTIANTEGFRRGLYKGVSMNWIKGPISVGVSFFVNDQVKAYLKEHREDESWG